MKIFSARKKELKMKQKEEERRRREELKEKAKQVLAVANGTTKHISVCSIN